MVTINKKHQYFNGVLTTQCEAFWKSTDPDKEPTEGIPNGTWGFEIDTGNVSLFVGDSQQWVYQFCMQG